MSRWEWGTRPATQPSPPVDTILIVPAAAPSSGERAASARGIWGCELQAGPQSSPPPSRCTSPILAACKRRRGRKVAGSQGQGWRCRWRHWLTGALLFTVPPAGVSPSGLQLPNITRYRQFAIHHLNLMPPSSKQWGRIRLGMTTGVVCYTERKVG